MLQSFIWMWKWLDWYLQNNIVHSCLVLYVISWWKSSIKCRKWEPTYPRTLLRWQYFSKLDERRVCSFYLECSWKESNETINNKQNIVYIRLFTYIYAGRMKTNSIITCIMLSYKLKFKSLEYLYSKISKHSRDIVPSLAKPQGVLIMSRHTLNQTEHNS